MAVRIRGGSGSADWLVRYSYTKGKDRQYSDDRKCGVWMDRQLLGK